MKKTILKDNVIVNIIVLEEGSEWQPPEGHTMRDWQKGDAIPVPPPDPIIGLREKGWSKLTAAEKEQALTLILERA